MKSRARVSQTTAPTCGLRTPHAGHSFAETVCNLPPIPPRQQNSQTKRAMNATSRSAPSVPKTATTAVLELAADTPAA